MPSRYVALHSEQESARRRVLDLQRRSAEATVRRETVKTELVVYQIDDVLMVSDVFEALTTSDFALTPKAALVAVDDDGEGLDEELLARRLGEISADLQGAFASMEDLVPEALDHPSWSDFRQAHDLPVGQRQVWEWAYNDICEYQQKRAKAAQRKSASPLWASGTDSLIRSIATAPLSGLGSPVVSPHEVAHLSALKANIEEAEAQVRALEQEERLARETLDATRQPEGFGLALQVLSVLAVLGMALPVIVMGFEVISLPLFARAGISPASSVGWPCSCASSSCTRASCAREAGKSCHGQCSGCSEEVGLSRR